MKKIIYPESENGFAAIVISMIILAIIGLLVLGFANTTLSDQKIALDNILSTQAYYNAETGINDVYTYISAYQKAGNSLSNLSTSSNCQFQNNPYFSPSQNIIDNNNSYSCVLIIPDPYSLEFKPLVQFQGQTFPIESASSTGIQYLNINWQNHNISGNLNFNGCESTAGKFRPSSSYDSSACQAPVLQVDLVPMNKLNQSVNNIINNTFDFYLQPVRNSNSSDKNISSITISNNGKVYKAYCVNGSTTPNSLAYHCLNSLKLPAGSQSYYVHVTPFYSNSDMSVSATSSSNNGVPLKGAQVLIDSTGDSSGVLRRLQERVCISAVCDNNSPIGAVISKSSVCKQFITYPGVFDNQAASPNCPGIPSN